MLIGTFFGVVVERQFRVREVLGSNPPKAESYKDFKMVLTASLCDAPHMNEFE